MLHTTLLLALSLPSSPADAADKAMQQQPLHVEFDRWRTQFGKVYRNPTEHAHAYSNFVTNDAVIAQLQAEDGETVRYGHTVFSDLSAEEFRALRLSAMKMNPETGRAGSKLAPVSVGDIPASFDWRDHGVLTPVKDQSSCGSCWAESAVENIESVVFIHGQNRTGSPTALSVEQLIECDPHDYACYGGYPSHAFEYVVDAGLATDADYPYDMNGKVICLANQTFNETCGDGICDDPPLTNYCDLTCSYGQHPVFARISSWESLSTDETQIAAYLATNNPISVAIDASGALGVLAPWLQFYHSGVANPKHCSTTVLDHAVLIVGYGEENGTPYWTVRNSWGEKWGEHGYFRLIRGQGRCGINTMAASAIA